MKTALMLIALVAASTAPAQVTNRWITRPATIGTGLTTFPSLLQYPQAEAQAKRGMEIAFFFDIDREGKAANFIPFRPADPSNTFVVAVRKALDAASFEPAIYQGEPVIVQLGASVIFQTEEGRPTPVVLLNISDQPVSERNYTGPQLIGGQAALLHDVAYPAIARAQRVDGAVELAFDIDTAGIPRKIRVVKEEPAGHGFGESALTAMRKARFIPAMFKGEPLKAPRTQRIDFNLQIIERYAPSPTPKKKN
jgi:TonB family protein